MTTWNEIRARTGWEFTMPFHTPPYRDQISTFSCSPTHPLASLSWWTENKWPNTLGKFDLHWVNWNIKASVLLFDYIHPSKLHPLLRIPELHFHWKFQHCRIILSPIKVYCYNNSKLTHFTSRPRNYLNVIIAGCCWRTQQWMGTHVTSASSLPRGQRMWSRYTAATSIRQLLHPLLKLRLLSARWKAAIERQRGEMFIAASSFPRICISTQILSTMILSFNTFLF